MSDEKNNSKGFGFICYDTPEEAHRAIAEMNNRPFPGYTKPLYVTFHEPKEIRRQKLAQDQLQRKQVRPPNMLQPVYPPPGYSFPTAAGPPQYIYPSQLVRQSPARGWTYPPSSQPAPSQPPLPRSHGRNPASAVQRAKVPDARRGPMEIGITIEQLALHPPEQQRVIIGERLYVHIVKKEPKRAPKITGMLLDSGWSIQDLLSLLESEEKLNQKIEEAVSVLENSAQ